MQDEAAGEVPVAFVVRSNNDIDTTEDEIKKFVSKQVYIFFKSSIFFNSVKIVSLYIIICIG